LHGSGFVMKTADGAGFEDAVLRAFAAFADKPRWQRIQRNGMDRDFGWERSAEQYVRVYEQAIANARR
jgi:starch synthase